MSSPQNLLMSLSAFVIIVGAMVALNRVSVWFAPAILVIAAIFMVYFWIKWRRAERGVKEASGIDFARLHAMQIAHLRPWLKEFAERL